MAVTITDNPNSITVKGQPLIYTATSTLSGNAGFKFIVTVKDEAATQVGQYYIPKNPNDILVFDLRDVVREEVKVDNVDGEATPGIIHNMPNAALKFMSQAANGCKKFTVEIGEYTTAGGVVSFSDSHYIYLFDGSLQVRDGYQNALDELDSDSQSNKCFLTDRAKTYSHFTGVDNYVIKCTDADYGTLAFLNDDATITDCTADKVVYRIYDSSEVLVNQVTLSILAIYGGGVPSSTTAEDKLLYFGAFPANLNSANSPILAPNRPSDNLNWSYYTWDLRNAGGTRVSEYIVFENTKHPCKHEPAWIAWTNSLGAWDYYRFDARRINSMATTSRDYQKTVGDYGAATFSFDTFDRQTTPYHVEANLIYELEAVDMPYQDTELMTSLLKSRNVMIALEDGVWLPVTLDTRSLNYHTDNISQRLTTKIKVKIAQKEIC